MAALCLFLFLFHANAQGKQGAMPPNVILIMTDDQGYGELSVHGNPILKTPALDQLHDQSIRFTDFHVAPMCTPTRGQLMTGIDAVRNGAVNVSSGRTLLRKEFSTIADFYSENGYRTGIFGKWHLGDNYPYRPQDRGFQETLWYPSSHIGSVPDFWENNYYDDVYIRNGKREEFQGYCTDVFFSHAMEWMSECAERDEPFFTYLPTNTPHQPFIAPESDVTEMRKVVEKSEFSRMESEKRENLIPYLAMIRNIDQNVKRLLEFLERETLAENTIVVFLTDNGSTFGPDYYNAGMRGRKTELYEGGHRVPLFIRWPVGQGFDNPRDLEGLTEVQDVLPTLLDLSGISFNRENFDGQSLAPLIRGDETLPGDRILFINYSRMPFNFNYPSPFANSIIKKNGAAVLWKKWRLLNNSSLYDLNTDPMQQIDVKDDFPQVFDFMSGKLEEWWTDVSEAANIPGRVIIGSEKENPSLLTACEWMDVFVDQQTQVERGVRKNSYWLLEVAEKGNYKFELRRWPRECNAGLRDGCNQGKSLPIAAARILISTAEKNIIRKQGINEGDQSAVFNCELNAGPITLHTWFDDQDQESLTGAYYVYVTKQAPR